MVCEKFSNFVDWRKFPSLIMITVVLWKRNCLNYIHQPGYQIKHLCHVLGLILFLNILYAQIKTVFSLNYNDNFFCSESSRVTMDPSQMFINRSFTSVNANALNLMMDGITPFFKFLLLLFINLFHILNFTVYIMIRVSAKISFCFGFPAHIKGYIRVEFHLSTKTQPSCI